MTTTLEKLKSHKTPPTTNIPSGHSSAPAMQAIVVDCVSIVNPQLASIIRNDTPSVVGCSEDSHPGCPSHSKVITAVKTRPFATCIPVVYIVFPTCHVWLACVQVLATTTLTEVERILHEKTVTVGNAVSTRPPSGRTHDHPSVSSVGAMVSEEHASMTTMFKKFDSNQAPSSMNVPLCHTAAPTMQTIIVDAVTIVNPQLAAVVRDKLEVIPTASEDSHPGSPSHSKVIMTGKSRPSAAGVPVVNIMFPTSHVWSPTVEILATAALSKPKGILHEKTVTIGRMIRSATAGARDNPSVASVSTPVSKQHTSCATPFKHFKSYQVPSATKVSVGLTIPPAMQTVIVDGIPIINP
jgi:hypothetical protein